MKGRGEGEKWEKPLEKAPQRESDSFACLPPPFYSPLSYEVHLFPISLQRSLPHMACLSLGEVI